MSNGPKLLRQYLKQSAKGLRVAAKEIGVSHPTLLSWRRGITTPIQAYRDRVEVWSAGYIPASEWQSARDRHAAMAIAKASAALDGTGTEG